MRRTGEQRQPAQHPVTDRRATAGDHAVQAADRECEVGRVAATPCSGPRHGSRHPHVYGRECFSPTLGDAKGGRYGYKPVTHRRVSTRTF